MHNISMVFQDVKQSQFWQVRIEFHELNIAYFILQFEKFQLQLKYIGLHLIQHSANMIFLWEDSEFTIEENVSRFLLID